MEHTSDAYLVRLIRVQRKIDNIREMLYTEESGSVPVLSMPLVMGVSSLEQELNTLEASLFSGITGERTPCEA